MLDEELQRLIMSWWQLPQQVSDLEEDAVEVHADLGRRHRAGAEPQGLQFLHDDALTFLCQTNEVVVISEQDERLRELQGENREK